MATGLHHKYPLSRPPSRSLLLFYAYRPVVQTSSAADEAQVQLSQCIELGLTGRLLIADEGINGTVGADTAACEAYVQWMCQVCARAFIVLRKSHLQ
jgi:predicted sulfurtransferase